MKNLLVAQSGGPCASLNAVLAGIIRGVQQSGVFVKAYGALNGIEGVLTERIVDLSSMDEDKVQLLAKTPAAFLGSCRFDITDSEMGETFHSKIFEVFNTYNIKAFIYIGGINSMKTAKSLCDYGKKIGSDVNIIAIPKTIDNDIPGTDFCVGFGSAAKFVATITKEIYADSRSYSARSVTIVEIMGRHAGWLCAAASLARSPGLAAPHFVYLADIDFDANDYISDIESCTERNIVVAVSEGLHYKNGRFLCSDYKDGEQNMNFGGCGNVLLGLTRESLGYKTRAIEINVLQRCAGHFMSKTDFDYAIKIGDAAVHTAADATGVMMSFQRVSSDTWQVKTVDIAQAVTGVRKMDSDFICPQGNNTTQAYDNYCRPLILGEEYAIFENGLPAHLL